MVSLISDEELMLEVPNEGSETTMVEEDEGCPHLSTRALHLDEVDKFNRVQHDEHCEIVQSWSGMNLEITTKEKVDMRVLSQRVHYLLNYAATHVKIMGALPKLLSHDGALLRKWLPANNVNLIERAFRRQSMNIEHSVQTGATADVRIDKRLQQAYRLLTMNKCVNLYILKNPPHLTPYMHMFLNALKEFATSICSQMEMTAHERKQRNAMLRATFDAVRERRFVLRRLHDHVEENIHKYEERFLKKEERIEVLKEQLSSTLEYYNSLKQNLFNTSDKILYFAGEASAAEQAELSVAAREAQVKYATTIDSNLAEERMLRTRKIKLEAQLSMWITKYDTDVGEKQHILDELNEDFQRENEDLHELECEIIEQQKVYDRCHEEQEEEYLDAIKAKLFVIASQRAARIIQKYWRLYLQRKKLRRAKAKAKAKKMAKKGKLKKK